MPPAAPVKKTGRNVALIITLVVLLVLCPCLGLAGWAVWKVADAARTPSTTAPAVPPALPSDAPTPAAPTPDEEEFARGDCLVNEGSEDDAELRKVPCGPDTYEVLLRIPATTDGDRCEALAPQATANYVHDNSIDLFDYVLCLRKR
ncbi:LppU/SCO3897 family protein [Micromonospora chokoriensis]|uniref:LppU/SCO3897 family protein n=1 Tax=Micromonospora chokoriensis TaxID=356851 RepID=UPI00068C4F0E